MCAADFANATLPTRVLDTAVRHLSLVRSLFLCSGKSAQWKGEELRAGVDVPDHKPFSLHMNAGGIQTADGCVSQIASTVKTFRA